jgi:AcrR family transcriptional regulator
MINRMASPAETSLATMSSAKKGRGRPPGISDRVRRDVYEAVRQILMTAGYGALLLEDVATAAGVHKSTLYRQWSSKAQLVGDVLSDGAAEHYPRPDPTTIGFVRTRAVADDPELSDGLRELGTANFGFVREPFKRAMARGEIDPALSVDALAELVISPFLARATVTRLPIDDGAAGDRPSRRR